MSFETTCSIKSPPKYYFDMYMERLPQFLDLHIGNWEVLEKQIPSIYALRGKLKEDDQRRMVAAYFGLITHIDHQISRFFDCPKRISS